MADELLIKKYLEKSLEPIGQLKFPKQISAEEWYLTLENIREPLYVHLENTPLLATYKQLFYDVLKAREIDEYEPLKDAVVALQAQMKEDIRVFESRTKGAGSGIRYVVIGTMLGFAGYKILKHLAAEESRRKKSAKS